MPTRRRFVRQSLFGLTLPALAPRLAHESAPAVAPRKPVIISTWDVALPANAAGWPLLQGNGHALDAVETAARAAEDLVSCCIGLSGYPDRDGHVTLDACLMDDRYRCGSVIFLEHIKHPISVARKIMETTPHVMLAGAGALQFALANGFVREPATLSADADKAWKEWLKTSLYKPVINIENQSGGGNARKQIQPPTPAKLPNPKGGPDQTNHDTIGILALDATGRLSGACTTSGLAFKMHGRVGDSPIIGSGLFVDNEVGAAVGTGQGEEIVRIAGAHTIIELMRAGASPQQACEQAIERIVKRSPNDPKSFQAAFLALDKNGQVGAYALQPGFNYALTDASGAGSLQNAGSYFK
jgi:N4-(beta-N-acetylglucosaminyl)-L-asparaginase